jgi:methionyl-tRNA formyltransferase
MKILFMGRKKYAAEMLRWTIGVGHTIVGVVTDSHLSNSPTTIMANNLHVPVVSLEKAEQSFYADNVYADLVVSYLYWTKIKEPFISIPKLGCINFHPAILPDWKGLAGYNIAILNKLTDWGASAHYVDTDIDTGKIIRVYRFNFDYRYETAKSIEEKTQRMQCDLYKSVITDIANGNISDSQLIQNVGGTYISKKEMLAMMQIDPIRDDIALKCHAFWFPPYSGATIEIQGKRYTLVDDLILSQLKDDDQTVIK